MTFGAQKKREKKCFRQETPYPDPYTTKIPGSESATLPPDIKRILILVVFTLQTGNAKPSLENPQNRRIEERKYKVH